VCKLGSRFHDDRPVLAAIALTTDSFILTALGNDHGYEGVVARQIEALGQAGDVRFARTTSGRLAINPAANQAARERGIVTVGLTGSGPGAARLATTCDVQVLVPRASPPAVQGGHAVPGRAIRARSKAQSFRPPP